MNRPLILFLSTFIFSIYLLNAQTTSIVDVNFENYLETHAADGTEVNIGDDTSMGDGIANNGLVLTSRINSVVLLDVSNLEISNLTGIEDFTALEILFCSNNNLSTLNISNNINLASLLCGSNNLTGLDLSNNNSIETLDCSNNLLQNLNLTSNTELKSLTASGNQLATINLINNPDLLFLSVSNNRITGDLNMDSNINLESLFCASNQISTLNVSNNTLLKNIDASNNLLTELDLSNINNVVCPNPQTNPVTVCQGLASINVSRNRLSSLVVHNGFNDLISAFNASENPDLFCIQIDGGFTPANWIKDDWTFYSETTCVDIYTYIPDANFEQALINLGYDNTLDNFVLTETINTIPNLNVSNASITSLVGIEDFVALEILDCSNNDIEQLDLSNNIQLVELEVSINNLITLNIDENVALSALYCSNNSLSSLIVSNNVLLNTLYSSNNNLTSLELFNNTVLSDLDVSFNQIESLNLNNNVALTSIFCNDNNLFALNLNNGNNNLLNALNATNNANLFCIEVDDVVVANAQPGWLIDATATYDLNCGIYIPDDNFEQALIDLGIDTDNTLNNFVATEDINTIITLDISGLAIENLTGIQDFVALENLNCSNNNLTQLDLSNNLNLQTLDASNNQIENLDLTVNTSLTSVLCNNNALLSVNMKNGNNTALINFNAANNPNLFCIEVDNGIVANIPAAWQKDDFATYNGDCINSRFTAIPDPFFEQALIDLGYDNIIDEQVLTSNIEQVLSLNVSNKNIDDLTGIQDFKSLQNLDCSSNFLPQLDVSNLLFLERLNCSSNLLLTNDINSTNGLLNMTGTVNLTELFCSDNDLNNLDISQNINLEVLDCANNNLNTLVIGNNLLLRTLNSSNNNLSSLNISSNLVLEEVNCNSNQITNLITSNIPDNLLNTLSCANNELAGLQVNNYEGLVNLNCSSNTIAELEISELASLQFLNFNNNQISEIILTGNIGLLHLFASQNNLTQLVLNANTSLEQLNCDFNGLSVLDLLFLPQLEFLSCTNNQIEELDLTGNSNLIEANFSSNIISNLMLSNNLITLKVLNASNNLIEGDLDLTTIAISACIFQTNQTEFCPQNITINVSNNLLEFINIQNGINANVPNFNASGNPNLECIQVDNTNNVPANWIKDEPTTYNEDCRFGETFIPDDNFEQALINLGLDSGLLDDYVPTANIEILTSLDVSGNGITDLTGIEDFTALENLNCSNNVLTEVDASANINITSLNVSNNLLTEINVSNNLALTSINCAQNSISTLDLSTNANLVELNIADNLFSTFTPSELPGIQIFLADNNIIAALDFQQNQSITTVSCAFNMLEVLNVRNGQNNLLTNLNALNNPDLTCIESDEGIVPNGANWLIDATAQFSIECFFGQTFVPDDNFEQALIDLGYDSGELDDYVFTENIENITFLNISGREISDLTGIEDFVSLSTLNIQDNLVANLNLETNTQLSNLNASENELADIDVSSLTALTDLKLGNNQIVQLNLDANISLVDLDISNNLLTELNVESLINLEDLICASNQLSALNVSQNTNLRLLFCQSNELIADQLNIQNGNNENLQLFNATNNPNLACILVDDPVAVISNENGLFDSWLKDAQASYQLICADADNDGVPNEDDLCPNTPFGATVDLFGCSVIDLPFDNFSIAVTSETCLNSNNGKITIIAQELYSYTATLTRENFSQAYNFTNDVDIFNLLAGTYQMCITIQEWPDYLSCFTIVITEPNPLVVFSSRMASSNLFSLDMLGSSSYNIKHNGVSFSTNNSSITLELQQGVNQIEVSTDLDCQGTFEKRIIYSDAVLVYPNPFNGQINVYSNNINEEVNLNVYSALGQLVISKTYVNYGAETNLDTSNLSHGFYFITLQSKSMTSTYKIMKQ